MIWTILGFGWRRRFGFRAGHLHDLKLGFIPFLARHLTSRPFDWIVCCDAYMMGSALVARKISPKAGVILDAHKVFYSELNHDAKRERRLRAMEEN